MRIKTILAINNRNGLNALKILKAIDIFDIKYILLHPRNNIKYGDEILSEVPEKSTILNWEKSNRDDILKKVQTEELDFLLSVNFAYIFKKNFLECFKETFNLHTGYLPYNRGMHPNVWPIIDGTPAGVTLHTMDAEIDKGKIIYQEKVEVEEIDTGKTLYEKLENKSMDVLKIGLDGYYTEKIKPFIPEEEGTYHSHQDFVDLFEINLKKENHFIRKLMALSFSPYTNSYFIDKNNHKKYVELKIIEESEYILKYEKLILGETPRSYSNTKEKNWCNHIKNKIGTDSLEINNKDLKVELEFYLNNITKPDIDNLAKSLIDTLFKARKEGELATGVLIDEDDSIINILNIAKKKVNKGEEGCLIKIYEKSKKKLV